MQGLEGLDDPESSALALGASARIAAGEFFEEIGPAKGWDFLGVSCVRIGYFDVQCFAA